MRLVHAALVLAILHATSPAEAKRKDVLSCVEAEVVGKVVSVKKGKVIVELDEEIETGTHLAVIPPSALEEHSAFGQALVCKHGGAVTAVVEVDEVSGTQASGPIGRASAATAGDLVFVTDWEPTYWQWWPIGPAAYGDIWDLAVRMYVLPDFWQRGASFEGRISLSYQFSFPLRLEVAMLQLLVAYEDESLVGVLPAFIVSYSSRYFELGLGVGMHGNTIDGVRGPSFFQTLRLGAVNSLMARVTTVFKFLGREWWDGGPEGLQFDSIFWEIKAPIHSRITFFMESWGGGVSSGGFRLTGGIELMFNGTGGPGTVIVPIGAGGGTIDWMDPYCDWNDPDSDCWEDDFFLMSFIVTTGIHLRW